MKSIGTTCDPTTCSDKVSTFEEGASLQVENVSAVALVTSTY